MDRVGWVLIVIAGVAFCLGIYREQCARDKEQA